MRAGVGRERSPSVLRREQVELARGIDRFHFAAILVMPEGPAVAARCALQILPEAVDRAGLFFVGERAVGADGGDPAALLVEDLGALRFDCMV